MEPPIEPEPEVGDVTRVGISILIADDEEIIRKAISRYLSPEGYCILEAATAAEAMHLAQAEHPTLILLDIHLDPAPAKRDRMEGVEICRRLKMDPSTSDIPIILITVLGDRKHVLAAQEAKADDFIVKPFHFKVLDNKIRRCLQGKGGSPPASGSEAPRRRRGSGLTSNYSVDPP